MKTNTTRLAAPFWCANLFAFLLFTGSSLPNLPLGEPAADPVSKKPILTNYTNGGDLAGDTSCCPGCDPPVILSNRLPSCAAANENPSGELEFCTYNINVVPGEVINLRDYVINKDDENQPLDWDHIHFTYTDVGANDPTVPSNWNLANFNAGLDVTILAADMASGTGNHGEGEYRIYLYRTGQTSYEDHATIRVASSGGDNGAGACAPITCSDNAEFIWQSRPVGSSSWTTISGADESTYDPPALFESTEFRRGGRMAGNSEYVYSDVVTIAMAIVAEICSNGTDDDGDGLVDGNDPDCACDESYILVARDSGQILEVNLTTGTAQVVTTSPYAAGDNLNALAANPNHRLVYYGIGQTVYYWRPETNTHGVLVNLAGQVLAAESLTSGAAGYYDGYLYLGFEDGDPGDNCNVYRIELSADGLSTVGTAVDLNIPIPASLSWGDLIIFSEDGLTTIYGMAAASGASTFWKYVVPTATFTAISTSLPTEMQLGVDIDGNAWAGTLSGGQIQQFDLTTASFYGTSYYIGGKIWDLTEPVNCPIIKEICDNGLDDDSDGAIDCEDSECYADLGYATSVYAQTGVTNSANATGAPNGTYAEVWETTDYITLDLGSVKPAGTQYEITWRRKSTYTDNVSAEMIVEESSNGSSYSTHPTNPSTTSKTDFVGTILTASTNVRYVRIKQLTGTGDDLDLDAIAILGCRSEDCTNGTDDDGDGLTDCADADCAGLGLVSPDATICAGASATLTAAMDGDADCDEFAQSLAQYQGIVTNPASSLYVPDGQGAFLSSVTANDFTRLVFDLGSVQPAGSRICVKVKTAVAGVPADFSAWILASGVPATGTYTLIGTYSVSSTSYVDFCFTLPSPNRYFKISQTSIGAFYVDALAVDCDDNGTSTYSWSTGSNDNGINVSPASTTTYSVTATNANGCSAMDNLTVTVNANPSVNAGADVSICTGGSATLTATGSGGTSPYVFAWSDGLGSGASKTVSPTSTTTYAVTVTDNKGCTGTDPITVTVVADPAISTQPTGFTECLGGSQTLSVVATGGTPSLTYQWQSSPNNSTWSNVSGATSVSYAPPATATGTTYYRVVVSASGNGCGSATSNSAAVVVVADPSISTHPTGFNQCVGGSQTVSVVATGGSPSLTYQWESSTNGSSWSTVSGATSASYVPPATTAGTLFYRVIVMASGNGCGSVTSNPATVVTVADPSISTQPAGFSQCVGGTQSLTVVATGGTPSLTYQWQSSADNVSFANVSGATTATYVPPSTAAGTIYYRVVVSASGNGCGSANSNSVAVVVTTSTTISAQPAGFSECVGGSQALSVTALGASLTYQWQSSPNNSTWSNVSGATSASYVPPATAAGTTYYRVVVTGGAGCGSVTSGSATVVVVADPSITTQPVGFTECYDGLLDLCVTATGGTPSLTYQWQISSDNASWANIGGATSACFTPNSKVVGTYYYRVVVSASGNGCGSVTSNSAAATVVNDPSISTQPTGFTECVGGSQSLSVTATGGTPSLTYQWQSSPNNSTWTNISGATSASYVPPATATGTTYYRVVVSASGTDCGSVNSGSATVVVVADPGISSHPTNITECVGGSQSLSVTATGGAPSLTYQWQSSPNLSAWSNVSGATSASYVPPSAATGTTYYRVAVSASGNGCGSVNSNPATVTVNTNTAANVTGTNSICPGGSTTLTATGGTSFVWSNGATSASIVVNPSSTTTYVVTATNGSGCTGTASRTVTVETAATVNAGSDQNLCLGESATLTASATGGAPYSYAWSGGLGNASTATASPTTTTTYTVTVTASTGCTATDQVTVSLQPALWLVDEDADGLGHLHLWSFGNYDDATGSATDYGRLEYFDPGTSTVRDIGDAGDLEAMAVNRFTGQAFFLSASKSNGGPSGSQALFTYNLNVAAANSGNIELTLLGHLTRPNGVRIEGLAFDPLTNRLYAGEDTDGNQNSSTTTDRLLYVDVNSLNANPLLASAWAVVGNISGSGYSCDYADGLEFDEDGNLYVVDGTDDHLYEIDPATGAIFALSDNNINNGASGSTDVESLAWDEVNNRMIAVDNDSHRFIEVTLGTNGGNAVRSVFLPGTPGLPTDADFEAAAMFAACADSKMSVGNLVFKDLDEDGKYDNGEGLNGVAVQLFAEGQNPLVASPVAATVTSGGGGYLFQNLAPGNYFVHVPASQFAAGKPLNALVSIYGAGGDNQQDDDVDENGVDAALPSATGVGSNVFNLTRNAEPTDPATEKGFNKAADDPNDANGDLTIDFGFRTYPEICGNGLDDDGDGLSDCDDPACPATVALAGNDQTICLGSAANLTASATGSSPFTFDWSEGLGAGASKTVSPGSTTTFTVTVTNSYGCTATDQVTVFVNPALLANAGADLQICEVEGVFLLATATGGAAPYAFNWSNGLGAGALQSVAPAATTTYSVTATDALGCTSADQILVTVIDCQEICDNGVDDDFNGLVDCADDDCAPVIFAGSDESVCEGTGTVITVTATDGDGSPLIFSWNNGLGAGQSHLVSPAATTTYSVTVTATGSGCSATDAVTVSVQDCSEICTDNVDNDSDGLLDCLDPDCAAVGMPDLADDDYATCPAVPFTERVTYNDGNLQNASFSIFSQPAHGTVAIDNTGKFDYVPVGMNCGTDEFVYQVCNSVSGCCATATVSLSVGDAVPPQLMNVPADLAVECDEEIPLPPQIVAFDACPGIYVTFDETTNEAFAGVCNAYEITRTWEAEDLCGNSVLGTQVVTVQDSTPPSLFRVYTLPDGRRMFGGILERVSNRWKSVYFPVGFDDAPVVFAQVITQNEASAVAARLKNVDASGFQIRLQEQELSTNGHAFERVAWFAIESGESELGFDAEAILTNGMTNAWQTLAFTQAYDSPGFLAMPQTSADNDPVTVRRQNLTGTLVQASLQEEISKTSNVTHAAETLGWLALETNANLTDFYGETFGETGAVSATDQWQTVNLQGNYNVPVVVMGALGYANADPATVRVRNVTSNSFEYKIQEWDYLDGIHPAENLTYLVLEGSLPAMTVLSAPDQADHLDLFAWDNCGTSVPFSLDVTTSNDGGTIIFHDNYSAEDACGNAFFITHLRTAPGVCLRAKAMLGGAMLNAAGGLMRDDLRQLTLIPLKEPYSQLAGFGQKGFGGNETTDADNFLVTGDKAFVDWVLVELFDPVEDTLMATTAAILQRDGNVVTASGDTALAVAGLQAGFYKVGIRHRNHLGLLADSIFYLNDQNPPLADFTSLAMPVAGGDVASSIVNGRRAMWAGDFNSDGKVIYQGPANDIFYLFLKVVGDPLNYDYLANYIGTGYQKEDFNMNGKVIYQGPNNDRSLVLFRSTLSHPSNGSSFANFVIYSYLP